MKTGHVCHHLFLTYSSGMQVWYLVSFPTDTMSVQYHSLWNTDSAYHHTSDKLNKRQRKCLSCPISHLCSLTASSIVCAVLLLSPVLSLRHKGEDTMSQGHVGLRGIKVQEYLTPKAEVWSHLLSSPFLSLLTGGSPALFKTKFFSFLLQFLYLKPV